MKKLYESPWMEIDIFAELNDVITTSDGVVDNGDGEDPWAAAGASLEW